MWFSYVTVTLLQKVPENKTIICAWTLIDNQSESRDESGWKNIFVAYSK